MVEENFPRGGSIPTNKEKPRFKRKDNLFANVYKSTKKRKSVKNDGEIIEFPTKVISNRPSILTFAAIHENMTILANILEIKASNLEVELPGRCFTTLQYSEISDYFLDTNTKPLDQLFTVGSYLPIRVLQVTKIEKGYRLHITAKPSHINSDMRHDHLKRGMLMWGVVAEALEHGYLLECGVRDCRVFMPFGNVEDGKKFVIGEPFWSVIQKSVSTPEATTLTVTTVEKHLKSLTVQETEINLSAITPGTQFDFDVLKIRKDGLHGKICEKYEAYINELYLTPPIVSIRDHQVGDLIKARVLYVDPSTKIVHLTLRDLSPLSPPKLKVGTKISSTVISQRESGLYIQLKNGEIGVVSYRRLIKTVKTKPNTDVVNVVKRKYKEGSQWKCRILDYSFMDSVYIVTFEKDALDEKRWCVDDLTVGQIGEGVVSKIQENGIEIKFGRVCAFARNIHLCNGPYSDSIKQKFKIGQKHNARVLNIKDQYVEVTLKPALVSSDDCLTSYEEAKLETQYTGTVVSCTESGALVAFYNDVKGWIPNHHLLADSVGQKVDARQVFYKGQVVSPKVLNVDGQKMTLSMLPLVPSKKKRLKLGHLQSTVVQKVTESGLEVVTGKRKAPGFIPLGHFSWSYKLNPLLLETYKPGDVVDCYCISVTENMPILSIRESIAYNHFNLKIPDFDDLKKKRILRCSFLGNDEEGIYVTSPINGFGRKLKIFNKYILDEDDSNETKLSFYPNQSIVGKISYVRGFMKKLGVSARLSDVFNYDYQYSLFLLEQYLKSVSTVEKHWKETRKALANYKLGEIIEVTVEGRTAKGLSVVLSDGNTKGLVLDGHVGEVEVGTKVEAVILWVNYPKHLVEVSLLPELIEKVKKQTKDNLILPKIAEQANLLLVKEDFALAILKATKQFVVLPTKLHENDFVGLKKYYKQLLRKKIEVDVHSDVNGFLIGLETNLKNDLAKKVAESVVKPKKRSRSENEDFSLKIEDISLDENHKEENNRKRKLVDEILTNSKKIKIEKEDTPNITLPGVDDFFSTNEIKEDELHSSDSDDSTTNQNQHEKKKKLSASERAELIKQDEERIRRIEKELSDLNAEPQSVEMFDRLLMGKPNSSVLWTKYIAFHLSSSEIEKARAVARKALETIDMTLVQEKLNVWIAFLNLENMYGTKDSFESAFEEAVKCNDDYTIYLETLKILAEAGKSEELQEKMKKFRTKFKHRPQTWIEIARILYKTNKYDEARRLKPAALRCIVDKKSQMDMLVQFAILEFSLGEVEQGEVLFETILTSYVKRVDVWCTYVDQLVKKGKIDSARRVLERAVSQHLPLMKMRTLFKKFKSFEESHGTPESIENVKKSLMEYVSKATKTN